jgi:5-amino-6-(5-phosphoribosylamino)uracil reductase
LDANVLSKDAHTIIATTKRAPEEKIKKLTEMGIEVLVVGDYLVDFELLLKKLREKDIKSLMVEGGSSINWELCKLKAVNEVRIIHLPVIVGGENVPTLVGGEGFKNLNNILHLRLRAHFKRGYHLITEWEVV